MQLVQADPSPPDAAAPTPPPQRRPRRPTPAPAGATQDAFPPEVDFVLSALEAGPRPPIERQRRPRMTHRVKATLKLFSDDADCPPWVVFTRHVNEQAVGFLACRQLPVSHGGVLTIRRPDGATAQVDCTVLRCRQAAPGWFEGAVYFNREQPAFAARR